MARQVFDDKFTYEAPQLAEPLIYQHPYEVIADTIRNQGLAEATREDVVTSLPDAFNVPHLTQDDDKYNAIVNPWKERLDDISKAYVANDPNARNMMMQLQKEIKDSRTNGDLYKMGLRKEAVVGWLSNNAGLKEDDRFDSRYSEMLDNVMAADNDIDIAVAGSGVVPLRPDLDMSKLNNNFLKSITTTSTSENTTTTKLRISDLADVGTEINGFLASVPGMAEYMKDRYGEYVDPLVWENGNWVVNDRLSPEDRYVIGGVAKNMKENFLKVTSAEHSIKPTEIYTDDGNGGKKTTSVIGSGSSATSMEGYEMDVTVDIADRSFLVQNHYSANGDGILKYVANKNIEAMVNSANVSQLPKDLVLKYPEITNVIANEKVTDKNIIDAFDKCFENYGDNWFSKEKKGYNIEQVDYVQRTGPIGSRVVSGYKIQGKNQKIHNTKGAALYDALTTGEKPWNLIQAFKSIQKKTVDNIDGKVEQGQVMKAYVENMPEEFKGIIKKDVFTKQVADLVFDGMDYSKQYNSSNKLSLFSVKKKDTDIPEGAIAVGRNQQATTVSYDDIKDDMGGLVLDVMGGKFGLQIGDTWYVWNPNEKITKQMLAVVRNFYATNTLTHHIARESMLNSLLFINSWKYDDVNSGIGKSKTVPLDDNFQKLTGINLDGAEPTDKNGKPIKGHFEYNFIKDGSGASQYSYCYRDEKGNKVDITAGDETKKDITYNNELELIEDLVKISTSLAGSHMAKELDSSSPTYDSTMLKVLGKEINNVKRENLNDFQKAVYDVDRAKDFDGITNEQHIEKAWEQNGKYLLNREYDTGESAVKFAKIVNDMIDNAIYKVDLIGDDKDNPTKCIMFKSVDKFGKTHLYLSYYEGKTAITKSLLDETTDFDQINTIIENIFDKKFKKINIK